MAAIKWWLAFAGYLTLYSVGMCFWWLLFPFQMAQVEFGSMASFGLLEMKRMVHDNNYHP